METLKKEKGCDWVRVPFKGGGEAVNAIMSGSTPIGLFGEGNVIGNIQAGQMTPLVMMNNIRSPNFPKVPLLTEVGYNGPPSKSWYGIFAPAGTPMRGGRTGCRRTSARSSTSRSSATAI